MDGNTAYDSQNENTNKIVNIYQDLFWLMPMMLIYWEEVYIL